jgi:hypothetical protein
MHGSLAYISTAAPIAVDLPETHWPRRYFEKLSNSSAKIPERVYVGPERTSIPSLLD